MAKPQNLNLLKEKMEIKLKNHLESAPRLSLFLKDLGQRRGLPKSAVSEMDLALGELLVNIIKYGYRPGESSFIQLSCEADSKKVSFLLSDEGKAFNPLKYKAKGFDASLKELSAGGLGIKIAKSYMDSLSYERKQGMNRLKLVKFIKKQAR